VSSGGCRLRIDDDRRQQPCAPCRVHRDVHGRAGTRRPSRHRCGRGAAALARPRRHGRVTPARAARSARRRRPTAPRPRPAHSGGRRADYERDATTQRCNTMAQRRNGGNMRGDLNGAAVQRCSDVGLPCAPVRKAALKAIHTPCIMYPATCKLQHHATCSTMQPAACCSASVTARCARWHGCMSYTSCRPRCHVDLDGPPSLHVVSARAKRDKRLRYIGRQLPECQGTLSLSGT
jgi:hypothetical protein